MSTQTLPASDKELQQVISYDPATGKEITCCSSLSDADKELQQVISYDPATGKEVGRAPLASAAEVKQAVGRARHAQPAWASLSLKQPATVLLKARQPL